jgi:cytochrome oxidase assembly protein ShyY1
VGLVLAAGGVPLLPALIPGFVALIPALLLYIGTRQVSRRENVDSSVERIDKLAGRQEVEITRLTTDRDYWRTRALKAERERDEQRDLNDHLIAECERNHRR